MNAARISIVVPTYNGEKYIRETLDCLFRQGYPDLEIIVVNDGSTDGTRRILESYGDRIRIVDQANQGHVKARNAGFRLMTGSLVATIDHDDLWPDDHLAVMVPYLVEGSQYDYVRGKTSLFGDQIRPEWEQESLFMPALMGACLFRRIVFERVGLLDEGMSAGDDFDWVARLNESGLREKRIDKVVLRYRRHETNTSLLAPGFIVRGTFHSIRNRLKRVRTNTI